MAPPQLAADAPRTDIGKPVFPDFVGSDRARSGCAAAHGGQRQFGHRFGVGIPLPAHERLDDFTTTLAARHVEGVVFPCRASIRLSLHVGPQVATAFKAILTRIRPGVGVHRRVFVHHVDDG